MKVNLTFKTPDIVEDAIREAQQDLERTASETAADVGYPGSSSIAVSTVPLCP